MSPGDGEDTHAWDKKGCKSEEARGRGQTSTQAVSQSSREKEYGNFRNFREDASAHVEQKACEVTKVGKLAREKHPDEERGNKGKVKHILRISMPTGGKEPWKGAKTFTHTGCSITSCKSETRGRGDTGMHEAILHKGGTSRVLAKTIASKFSQ